MAPPRLFVRVDNKSLHVTTSDCSPVSISGGVCTRRWHAGVTVLTPKRVRRGNPGRLIQVSDLVEYLKKTHNDVYDHNGNVFPVPERRARGRPRTVIPNPLTVTRDMLMCMLHETTQRIHAMRGVVVRVLNSSCIRVGVVVGVMLNVSDVTTDIVPVGMVYEFNQGANMWLYHDEFAGFSQLTTHLTPEGSLRSAGIKLSACRAYEVLVHGNNYQMWYSLGCDDMSKKKYYKMLKGDVELSDTTQFFSNCTEDVWQESNSNLSSLQECIETYNYWMYQPPVVPPNVNSTPIDFLTSMRIITV
jgi:hypothetical protein